MRTSLTSGKLLDRFTQRQRASRWTSASRRDSPGGVSSREVVEGLNPTLRAVSDAVLAVAAEQSVWHEFGDVCLILPSPHGGCAR